MPAETIDPTIDTVRADLVRVLPEAQDYLDKFADKLPLAIIKVGGEIAKDPHHLEELTGAVDHLRRLGFPCVIVHGGGPQIDEAYEKFDLNREKRDGLGVTSDEGIGHVYSALLGVNGSIASKLKPDTFVQMPILAKAELVDYEKYGWVGEPKVDKKAKQKIKEALAEGQVPVIASLGRVAVWDGESDESIEIATNVNADDLARELVRQLKPHKYVSLTGPGGVLNDEGKIISYMHPEEVEELIDSGTINGGMAKKVKEMLTLFEDLKLGIDDIVITWPENLIRELFTHEGAGTLLTREKELARYEKGKFNEKEVRTIIETAFSNGDYFAQLDEDYFELPDISHILLTPQRYGAVGIIRAHEGFQYLCKIAAIPEFRGRGLSTDIIEQAASDGKPLFWRARIEERDEVNVKLRESYAKRSDQKYKLTSDDGVKWMVYGKNTDNMSPEELEAAKAWVANQPKTIARRPNEIIS